MFDSKMLLLDEPISVLDPNVAIEMYNLIEELNCKDNITIIMITHNIQSALKYASHIMHIGKIFFTDDTVMTVAIADAIMNGGQHENFIQSMKNGDAIILIKVMDILLEDGLNPKIPSLITAGETVLRCECLHAARLQN